LPHLRLTHSRLDILKENLIKALNLPSYSQGKPLAWITSDCVDQIFWINNYPKSDAHERAPGNVYYI
jgi:hypothetical protein